MTTETPIRVPYFDNAELRYVQRDKDGKTARQALNAFLKLTPEDRLKDSRHVYAYYQDCRAAVAEPEYWIDRKMGVPSSPEDIWAAVTPKTFWLEKAKGVWYVLCECNCVWEIEHGLQLVWQNGKILTKAGAFDGEAENWKVDEDVVYAAPKNSIYLTRR